MRMGVFGGTFDPVHIGHLTMAEQCREQAGLDQVRFIPAARPPHKLGRAVSPFNDRVEMLRLAAAGHPCFVIDELEAERPGPSFTVDTLETLAQRYPEATIELIVGGDCLGDLPGWKDPARILELAGLLIVRRPGFPSVSVEQLRSSLGLDAAAELRCSEIDSPLVDISSNALRERVTAGRSVRYWTPRAVECYIETHKLYRPK
ncbi:nicotinate-nucleotide adenylyltransferase [soil metagenome]